MKKSLLIMIAALLSINAMAFYGGFSNLSIKLWNQSFFKVSLDNYHNESTNGSAMFNNITPGYHFLTVRKSLPGSLHGVKKHKILYSGYIYVPAGSNITVMVLPQHKIEIESSNPVPAYGSCGGGYGNYLPGMEPATFSALEMMMHNSAFDSNKLIIAKQSISSNYISSDQVCKLMMILTFESSKLELAKFAYTHTFDKENYFMVNKAFNFSSSIEELNAYIYRGL